MGHEFNNLNADEILIKIGLGDAAATASTPYSTSTLTPSSSYSMSLSSSTQSIHSSTLANKRTAATTTTTVNTKENSNIRYEEVVNYGPNTASATTTTTTGFNGYPTSLSHSKSTATVSVKSLGQSSDNSNEFIFPCKKMFVNCF